MTSIAKCSLCGSTQVVARNYARKVCSAAGVVAGAASGASAALGGAEAGAALGAIAGPVGLIVGGFAGALLGAMIGGTAGCAAGAAFGGAIDANVLNNFQCKNCGHDFRRADFEIVPRDKCRSGPRTSKAPTAPTGRRCLALDAD